MKILFFVGKGGVGKSTTSSLFAIKLALSGKSVILNSIDPAHNLHNIFRFRWVPKQKASPPIYRLWKQTSISGSRNT